MAPIATRAAMCLFAGAVLMLAAGLIASSPTAVLLSVGALCGLAAAFGLTAPMGARLRRERLEFAWRLDRPEGASVTVGAPFELRCQLYNHGHRRLVFAELTAVLPTSVQVLEGTPGTLEVPPSCRAEFALRLGALCAGRVVAQGFAVAVAGPCGLFLAPLYFPTPLPIRVLPRSAGRSLGPPPWPANAADPRVGARALRKRGAGSELHELREHRAGDPFNAIAWKASARAGKLLVRELEREVQNDLQLVLDVGGTMRGGAPGQRKLDHAIELCALLSRHAIERGDRAGLITVDGRIISRVNESEGLPHMLRIYEALLHATELVDADLTEADDDYVVAAVGLYLRQQLGLGLIRDGRWDVDAIVGHTQRLLAGERDGHDAPVSASTPAQVLLRRFCRARGIALPYRSSTRRKLKQEGIAAAMRAAAGVGRAPRTVLVISDLDGLPDASGLLPTLRLLTRRRHTVAFVFPDAGSLLGPPRGGLERDLRRVYDIEERTRRTTFTRELGALGVPVLSLGGQSGAAELLRRLAGLRRAA